MSDYSFAAHDGPPFAHLIDDIAHFVHDYKTYVSRLSVRVASPRTVERLHEQRSQISSCNHEIEDLRNVNYRGLQRVFTKPQVIVLEEFRQIIQTLYTHTLELRPILRHDFSDKYVQDLVHRLQDTSHGLTHRINLLLTAWRPVHLRTTSSPLCPSGLALNSGIDTGHIHHIGRTHLSYNERHILSSKGGAFNYWCCPECHLEKKFYARRPHDTIETTDESIKDHDAKLSYRVVLLAKSHTRKHASAKYACLICLGQGREAVGFNNTNALISHMGSHRIGDLPAVFMRKLHFTTKDQHIPGERWDLKFW